MQDNVVVFLHGFLGTSEDWTAIMKAVSRGARCISIDLPGHGETEIHKLRDKDASLEPSLSIEVVADVVYEVIHRTTPKRVTVVGYSMGARIALYMALRFTDKVDYFKNYNPLTIEIWLIVSHPLMRLVIYYEKDQQSCCNIWKSWIKR